MLFELRRQLREPRRWSLHTKMTLTVTAALLAVGAVFVTSSEWSNPATLGALDAPGRVLAGFFQAVMPRTAGFNTVDYGQMNEGTLLGTNVLMFIGGGSAGTAGGIKVTTFILLFFVIYTEVRVSPVTHTALVEVKSAVVNGAPANPLRETGSINNTVPTSTTQANAKTTTCAG